MNFEASKLTSLTGRKKWLSWAWAATVIAILAACATLPETGKQAFVLTTPSQEINLGANAFADIKRSQKISQDPAINAQVQRVAKRVIEAANMPHLQWEVVVFDDPNPNAFALPGGKIGVHTGILPITASDAGLAAVLGHEIAHISQRHAAQRLAQQMALLGVASLGSVLASDDPKVRARWMTAIGATGTLGVILPYSRQHELEADALGIIYAARAGYDPREAPKVWARMAQAARNYPRPLEFLSTHPVEQTRIRALEAQMPRAMQEFERSRIR